MTCPHTPTPSIDTCRSRRRERIHLTRIGVKHLPWGECCSCGRVLPPREKAAVAQKVERPPCKRVVPGPIPGDGSKKGRGKGSPSEKMPIESRRQLRTTGPLDGVTNDPLPTKTRRSRKGEPQSRNLDETGTASLPTNKEYLLVPPNPPSKMGRPPKCKCAVCKVVNRGGRPKGMTRQGEKRKGWPLGVKRGPRKVAA